MDSNNSLVSCGAGEREGRVFSQFVADRHLGYVLVLKLKLLSSNKRANEFHVLKTKFFLNKKL